MRSREVRYMARSLIMYVIYILSYLLGSYGGKRLQEP
jgi:hypothetical protein